MHGDCLGPPLTADALRGDASLTPGKAAPAGTGAGTWDQLAPFQCSMSVARAFFVKPIAHASDADAALTAKSLVSPPEPETGTWDQLVPFQCSISGRCTSLPLTAVPTAQPSVADTMLTPNSWFSGLGLGLGTRDQLMPFQCSISVASPVLGKQFPTAQPSAAESMLTPFRWHKGAFGPVTPDQLVPFQCRISGPLVPLPTAHASDGDTALTPLRKPRVLVTDWCAGGCAAAASAAVSTRLPPAGRASRHPRRQIERTVRGVIIATSQSAGTANRATNATRSTRSWMTGAGVGRHNCAPGRARLGQDRAYPVGSATRRQVAWASVTAEWTAPAVERADPDHVAAERRALEQWLDYHRDTLLTSCAGLTAEQLKGARFRRPTSRFLGLVRHIADVERGWFRQCAAPRGCA